MKVNQVVLHIVLMIACLAGSSLAETQWPDWRGPGGQGISDAVGLPLNWSETQNVAWKTPIHDHGHSTPVVWGNQAWLTTATKDGTTLYAVCLDVETGKIIHDKAVFQNDTPPAHSFKQHLCHPLCRCGRRPGLRSFWHLWHRGAGYPDRRDSLEEN